MAQMFPRALLDADVKSNAERKVFAALRDGLSDAWEAYHSASWVRRDLADGLEDDELDFVLCHPESGIVCLEVKGGGIECRYGEWYRAMPGGPPERMRDPVQQTIDHRYGLERKLKDLPGWRSEKLFFAWALALPDVTVHELVLAADAPRELIIDRNEVRDRIAGALDRVLAYHQGARDKRDLPGAKGAGMIRKLLAPRIEIRVPMAELFLEEQEQLVLLTHEQSRLLDRFGRNKRMVVTGCAGSGKTALAVEQAKRLADMGRDVLFVCFNRGLREWLQQHERSSGVAFSTFHGLCAALAKEAGLHVPWPKEGDENQQEFWERALPDLMFDALDQLGGRYDAVLVDEAQDLHDHWLTALTATLRDEADGLLWVFLDDNQRVYHANLEVPGDFLRYDLSVNCRNTQAIHREVMRLYRGQVSPEALGPAGRDMELLHSDDQVATVAGVLERLCGDEEVPPQDVVVLSSHGWDNSLVAHSRPGQYRFTKERGKLGKHVTFSSIRGFKGLESPVVVLCELEDLDEETQSSQLYVGVSRARNHCVVVAPPAA